MYCISTLPCHAHAHIVLDHPYRHIVKPLYIYHVVHTHTDTHCTQTHRHTQTADTPILQGLGGTRRRVDHQSRQSAVTMRSWCAPTMPTPAPVMDPPHPTPVVGISAVSIDDGLADYSHEYFWLYQNIVVFVLLYLHGGL